jgi:hypothetical protein
MSYEYTYEERANGFTLLEPGNYIASVARAEFSTSQNGNKKVTLFVDVQGVEVRDTLTFTAAAAWRIDQFLKATSRAPEKGAKVDVFDAETWAGAIGFVEIVHEAGTTNPDAKFNKVKSWLCDAESIRKASDFAKSQAF